MVSLRNSHNINCFGKFHLSYLKMFINKKVAIVTDGARGQGVLLRNENVSSNERLEYAEVIERQSLYMKELVDDFNLTMRLRNQEMPLQRQDTTMGKGFHLRTRAKFLTAIIVVQILASDEERALEWQLPGLLS